ncbi:unnamed protein product [Lota lota]
MYPTHPLHTSEGSLYLEAGAPGRGQLLDTAGFMEPLQGVLSKEHTFSLFFKDQGRNPLHCCVMYAHCSVLQVQRTVPSYRYLHTSDTSLGTTCQAVEGALGLNLTRSH